MSQERVVHNSSGFLGLAACFGMIGLGIWAFTEVGQGRGQSPALLPLFGGLALVFSALLLCLPGLYVVNPNDSRVLVLFGKYVGTAKSNGFFWTNPFTMKHRVSLRARTLNGEKLKVNDKAGNPIEIAAVVVWQVRDTYAAKFDVDNYEEFVHSQSETAVRKLASHFHYDGEENEITLRGSTEDVNEQLCRELEERLGRAGVHVIEARISHLAYAQEIAQAMLQRQQAHAVVAARAKIVEGAVGMVEMALDELNKRNVVHLDDERRAAMVSNLLVVLCGDKTTPVINTGTLYN